MILTIDDNGVDGIDFRKVAYSHPDELLRAANTNIPYIELYQRQMETGEVLRMIIHYWRVLTINMVIYVKLKNMLLSTQLKKNLIFKVDIKKILFYYFK